MSTYAAQRYSTFIPTPRPVVLPMMDFQGIYRIASSSSFWCCSLWPRGAYALFPHGIVCISTFGAQLSPLRMATLGFDSVFRPRGRIHCRQHGHGGPEVLLARLTGTVSATLSLYKPSAAPGRRAASSGRVHSNFIFVVFYFVKYVTWFLEFTYWLFLKYANAPRPSGDRGEMAMAIARLRCALFAVCQVVFSLPCTVSRCCREAAPRKDTRQEHGPL